jgi:hypothetical protein
MINLSNFTTYTLLLTVLISCSSAAEAQLRKAKLGLRAGVSFSNIVVQSTGPNTGFPQYFGPYESARSLFVAGDLEFNVGESLDILTGLSFIGKGAKRITASGDNATFYVIQAPVNLVRSFSVFKQGFFVGAGTYVSYIAAGMEKDPNHVPNDVRTLRIFPEDDLFQRIDVGLNMMAGVKFSSRLKVQAGYDYGLVKMLKGYHGNSLLSRTLTVGLGYQLRPEGIKKL